MLEVNEEFGGVWGCCERGKAPTWDDIYQLRLCMPPVYCVV